MGQGDALGGSRRQCHLGDPVKELKDPPERRFLGGLFRLAGNAFPGLDKGSAEVFFCQVVDEKSQHHQKHEPFDALFLLQVHFGGPKGGILEKSESSLHRSLFLVPIKELLGRKGSVRIGKKKASQLAPESFHRVLAEREVALEAVPHFHLLLRGGASFTGAFLPALFFHGEFSPDQGVLRKEAIQGASGIGVAKVFDPGELRKVLSGVGEEVVDPLLQGPFFLLRHVAGLKEDPALGNVSVGRMDLEKVTIQVPLFRRARASKHDRGEPPSAT